MLPILAFDTSAAHCVAALLWEGGHVWRHEPMQKGQAERLMPMLEEMLTEAGLRWGDLRAIGVGVGPGNFTGIRIAVAAARGLALGLGIPAVGVTAFELYQQGFSFAGPAMISLPAPRGEAYVQTFLGGKPITAATVLTPGALRDDLRQPNLMVFGYRAEEIARPFNAEWDRSETLTEYPEAVAANIAEIALNKLQAAGGKWSDRPAPFYVRGADAAPPADPPPVILP
ncbi:MAG: tRNA (adenosine(37)-N6)-threonylcarbamoyltransferase complex dimerization subunit type 1 TsaB [Rhodobacterales bacterium]|nr:tRNA (adenosine(37)-N6)-threonylcarbamoyltransferase complex dimerization subunit type 1 TsaB [Rhodobacterales bacterium]